MKKYLLSIFAILFIKIIFCQNNNTITVIKDTIKQSDSLDVLGFDKLDSSEIMSLPTLVKKEGVIGEKRSYNNDLRSYQKIVVGRVFTGYTTTYYNDGSHQKNEKHELAWRFEREENNWRSFNSLNVVLERFPESDSLYKLDKLYSLKSEKSIRFVAAGLVIGLASAPFFVTEKPKIAGVLVGAGSGTLIFGFLRGMYLGVKGTKYIFKAIDNYNKSLETAEIIPSVPKYQPQLSIGLATNYPGIGLKLSF